MKQLTLLALMLAMASVCVDAAEKGKEINLSGTLRVITKKNAKGTKTTRVYLKDDKGKMINIRLALKDKNQTPKVKKLRGKRVQIMGIGTIKVRGKVTTVTLTEIEKFGLIAGKDDNIKEAADE